MMNAQQVINTSPQRSQSLSQQASYWVAAYMVAGIVGLALIGLAFRKHVEL
jgi:hypothetical protein